MSNQAGHRAITQTAIHELYAGPLKNSSGADGLSENAFYDRINSAQARADVLWGNTTHPASLDNSAQGWHALADVHKTGPENVARFEHLIKNELSLAREAHTRHDLNSEYEHLGKAVHLLEDSYSQAHVWRADSVQTGDPRAPIQGVMVFDWLPHHGEFDFPFNTHDRGLDSVPTKDGQLQLGVHKAGAAAVTETLAAYIGSRDGPDAAFLRAINVLDQLFEIDPSGVQVYRHIDPDWRREHDRREKIQDDQIHHGHQQHAGVDRGVGFGILEWIMSAEDSLGSDSQPADVADLGLGVDGWAMSTDGSLGSDSQPADVADPGLGDAG